MPTPFLPQAFKRLQTFLDKIVSRGVTPGAAAYVGGPGAKSVKLTAGRTEPYPEGVPVRSDTVYDLASLTKPLATAVAILLLADNSLLSIQDDVESILPEFHYPAGVRVRIEHLLTHTSGLPDWYPLYKNGIGREKVLAILQDIPLQNPPGTKVVYSCLGYILLGEIVRRLTGESLDGYCHRRIFAPLGLKNTGFALAGRFANAAPTELGNGFEQAMAQDRGIDIKRLRDGRIMGEPHDGNAFACDCEGGNAGLFASLDDLEVLGRMWMDGPAPDGSTDRNILKRETRISACVNQTISLNESRGFGWHVNRNAFSAGSMMSEKSFGHTGFTGTSLWIDPERHLLIILLTNRAYWGGDGKTFARMRPEFHDLAIECWERSPEVQ